jgi:hypothetical protein
LLELFTGRGGREEKKVGFYREGVEKKSIHKILLHYKYLSITDVFKKTNLLFLFLKKYL